MGMASRDSNLWALNANNSKMVRVYFTASSWHFLLLTSCTPTVMGWTLCWVFTKVRLKLWTSYLMWMIRLGAATA